MLLRFPAALGLRYVGIFQLLQANGLVLFCLF